MNSRHPHGVILAGIEIKKLIIGSIEISKIKFTSNSYILVTINILIIAKICIISVLKNT